MNTLAAVWLSFQLFGGGELVVRKDRVAAVMEDRGGMGLPSIAIGSKARPAFYVCVEGVSSCFGIDWTQDMKALRRKIGADK